MPLAISGPVTLLQVFDMPTSPHFYRDLLGFRILSQSRPGAQCGWAWLGLDGAEIMLNTACEDGRRPAAPDPACREAGRP